MLTEALVWCLRVLYALAGAFFVLCVPLSNIGLADNPKLTYLDILPSQLAYVALAIWFFWLTRRLGRRRRKPYVLWLVMIMHAVIGWWWLTIVLSGIGDPQRSYLALEFAWWFGLTVVPIGMAWWALRQHAGESVPGSEGSR